LQRALFPLRNVKSDMEMIVDLARACGAVEWMHAPWSSVLKEISRLNPGYSGVTPRDLMQGIIPQTTLAAAKEALPDEAELRTLAESIRLNPSRSLYAAGSLASHSPTLVQLEPRAGVQQVFVETYQM